MDNSEQERQQQGPPMVPPWWMPQQMMMQQRDNPVFTNDVPARVMLAARYSMAMAQRANPICAVNSVGFFSEPPMPLTNTEIAAWDASNTLLHDYFKSTVEEDYWEGIRGRALEMENDRRKVGKMLHCVCTKDGKDEPKPKCEMCHGCGRVLVLPGGE